jgi:hypothetical protein
MTPELFYLFILKNRKQNPSIYLFWEYQIIFIMFLEAILDYVECPTTVYLLED